MAQVGNIRNPKYWQSSKHFTEYVMNGVCADLPRGISPSDIDQCIECRGHFLVFELKTAPFELPLPTGQRIFWEAWFDRLRKYGTLFVVEHERLDRVDLMDHTRRMSIARWDTCTNAIAWTPLFPVRQGHIKQWVDEWCKHTEEKMNKFISAFRQKAGIYPPSVQRLDLFGEALAGEVPS